MFTTFVSSLSLRHLTAALKRVVERNAMSSAEGASANQRLPKRKRTKAVANGKTSSVASVSSTVRRPPATAPLEAPHNMSLQVLQSGCTGFGKSLLISTDTNRMYLFNCPELNNKLSLENRKAILRTDVVFFTSASWENLAGFGPLCLFLHDGGYRDLMAYGPVGVKKLIDIVRPFSDRDDAEFVHVVERDYLHFQNYEDEALKVTMVPFFAETKDNSTSSGDVAFAYICEPKDRAGRLSIETCLDIGVPVGPMLRELKLGKPITLPNGRVVEPQEVVSQPIKTPPILILECPSQDFITDLLDQSDSFEKFARIKNEPYCLVAHLGPTSVLTDPRYLEFCQKVLGSHPRHLVLNSDAPLIPHSYGLFREQLKLNLIEPNLHPMLPSLTDKALLAKSRPDVTALESGSGKDKLEFIYAVPSLKFELRPNLAFQNDSCFIFDSEEVLKEVWDVPNIEKALEAKDASLQAAPPSSEPFPSILFFGTSSAGPGKTRNMAAILVKVTESQSILLDCGEGAYFQMVTFFGHERVRQELVNIKAVCISHLHTDHHHGLLQLIQERERAFRALSLEYEMLDIVAPGPFFAILVEMAALVGINIACLIERCFTKSDFTPQKLKAVCERTGLSKLEIVLVFHYKMPCGFLLETGGFPRRRILYSGDTGPCESLVQAGTGCDVLIHEATFSDAREEDARRKRHSTVSDAITAGRQMGAKNIILTHFSNRYRIPIIPEDAPDNVSIAFDFMQIDFGNLPRLTRSVREAVKTVFWEYYDSAKLTDEMKAARKQLPEINVDEPLRIEPSKSEAMLKAARIK